MRLSIVSQPSVEPVSSDEVRARLGIGTELADETIDALITAARQTIDGAAGWLGRALITQTWRGTLDSFPCCIDVPLPPLQDVLSLSYVDPSGDVVELDPAAYHIVQGPRPLIVPVGGWPATRCQPAAVTVEFIAGYGDDPEDVPEPIRMAIVMMVSHLRSMTAQNLFISEKVVEGVGSRRYVVGGNAQAAIDSAVNALLSTYRVFG